MVGGALEICYYQWQFRISRRLILYLAYNKNASKCSEKRGREATLKWEDMVHLAEIKCILVHSTRTIIFMVLPGAHFHQNPFHF